MIPTITSNPNFQNVIISTGNILNVNSKLGRKSNEELLDGLKLTLESNGTTTANHVEFNKLDGQVLRATQELNQKLTENERPEISIGAKIFLNKNSNVYIEEAINTMLQILKVQHVDNVVLAYHPTAGITTTTTTTTISSSAPTSALNSSSNANSKPTTPNSSIDTDNLIKLHSNNSQNEQKLNELIQLWTTLEQFALQKKITQLGISDLDIDTLTQLHSASRFKPTIAQINLSSCCVVPIALQEFCTKNDIQLLTHSDPEILLPDEQFIIPGYTWTWSIRYQVHVRCRGVLTAKGYIMGASREIDSQ